MITFPCSFDCGIGCDCLMSLPLEIPFLSSAFAEDVLTFSPFFSRWSKWNMITTGEKVGAHSPALRRCCPVAWPRLQSFSSPQQAGWPVTPSDRWREHYVPLLWVLAFKTWVPILNCLLLEAVLPHTSGRGFPVPPSHSSPSRLDTCFPDSSCSVLLHLGLSILHLLSQPSNYLFFSQVVRPVLEDALGITTPTFSSS